jgi:hypothetical protein
VEGVFDAIRVWEAGFTALALHGQTTRFGDISTMGLPVIVLFDKDAVLQAELTALEGASLGILTVPASHRLTKKDPGETSPAKLRSILEATLREMPT